MNLDNTVVPQHHQLSVVKGELNPLKRQINKRIISLDTQMRTNLSAPPNNITLDLNEPILNVIALRVLSLEMRHSWYTFDAAYGTNRFFC